MSCVDKLMLDRLGEVLKLILFSKNHDLPTFVGLFIRVYVIMWVFPVIFKEIIQTPNFYFDSIEKNQLSNTEIDRYLFEKFYQKLKSVKFL